jgi:Holliday junction resolvasome RuvABC endonuclease subunit
MDRAMTTPRVLALDLSLTATGVAHPDGQLTTIAPNPSHGDGRLATIRTNVRAIITATQPTLVALEGPVTRSQAATTIGMVHGAVRVELLDLTVPYLIAPPAAIKTYATGKGNATKPDMRMALYKRTGHDVNDNNQVDAAWLRLLALDLAGHPELDLPQTHRRALNKLALPAGQPA